MRFFLILGAFVVATAAGAAEAPARARLCPENLPEGVRLPPPPGCAAAPAAKRRDDGFRDLGGVSVRVTGRAAAEFGAGR
ncbi:hypothetical protein Q8W71_18340 [Methylobacterium sp. NEAU 140]|uniref:hypothetical protein n=1 Tax=Methylobacterium sp. NEAU 140 TaxID=3064945 RepID=UPI002734799F|nr:hypothetical protein [Methylobacterium sp. NEAU 140]MDP4024588.1 hypothetical protein [Methylobacterium sp. NEAU 140]